jgi:hypothetical protein
MLILINMTGLERWYWLPSFARESDGDGLWYWDVKWLGVQLSAHSKPMGCEMIRRFGATLEKGRPG